MQASLSKRFIGIAVAIVLAFGMIPALALSAPAKAEAATVTAGTIAKTGATSLSKKGATDLTKLMISNDLKQVTNTVKWIKNKNAGKTSTFYQHGYSYDSNKGVYVGDKYVEKRLADYTGKARKPKVDLYVRDASSTKVYTDATVDLNTPSWWEEEDGVYTPNNKIEGYTKLKGVTITGKESKKSLKKKIKGKDYTVQYENNKALGTAQIIIKGVNNYKGTYYDTFSIQIPQITKVTAKGKSKALKASWSKVKGASGYVVTATPVVAEKSEWSNRTYYTECGPSKTVVVSSKKKAVVIKKLLKKTDYQVTVRAFANANGGSYQTSDVLKWGKESYDETQNRWVYENEKVVVNSAEYPNYINSTYEASITKPVKTK